MATYSAPEAALLQGIQANRYCALVSLTILYYDYVATFPVEVERFWKRSCLSWVSALFIVNRYLSLLGPIPVAIEFFGILPEIQCRKLQSFHQYYAVFTQAVVAALLVLRTYALYNQDRRILCLMLIACASGVVLSVWSLLADHSLVDETEVSFNWPGCDLSLSIQQARHLTYAWSSMLAFDTLVFILTVVRAVQVGGLWKGTLCRIMLRDGAVYYGIMVMANIANILTFMLAVPTAKGMCTTLTNVVSSTLITRLMLNLRDPDMQVFPRATVSTFGAESCTTYAITFTNSEAVFSDCLEEDLWIGSYADDCTQ